jgi:hypothetical protein
MLQGAASSQTPRRSSISTAPAAKLVEPGQGKTIMLYGVRFDYKLTSADSGGALSALQVTIPPGILVKPHNHSREDEFTVVLAGTVGPDPARVLEVVAPGGLEDYFEELAPALAAKIPPAEYDALAARYGLTIQNDWIEELERTYKVKL